MLKVGEILEAVFGCCPSEYFDKRIGGQAPNGRIRSTIPHPGDALESLRRRFSDQDLVAAGVTKPDAFGELRIVPRLCQPGGIVMATRKSPDEAPFDLVTERGSLTGARHPVLSALSDGRRVALLEETGVMFVARRLADVAGLDVADLPATYGFGLSGMSLSVFREVDAKYGEGLPKFFWESQQDEDAAERVDGEVNNSGWKTPESDDSPAFRPMLVLVDRLRQRPGNVPSIWLRKTAGWLAEIRRFAGLPLMGVWVWQPECEFQERLTFALKTRDRALIRNVILESLTSLVDIETLAEVTVDPSGARPNYLNARRDVINQLGMDRGELAADNGAFMDSLLVYDSAVQAELAEPLINWAEKNNNPVVRAAGSQLAEVVTLMHRIAPRLHALQLHGLTEFSAGDSTPLDSGAFTVYMRLLDRFIRLSNEIMRWKAP